jgi:ATP-dependent protease HslVU (ClpYQ) peptidase subunit
MINFQTKHHADVMMFDKVALKLIHLMGHSGTVPSAFSSAEEIEAALNKLKSAVSTPSAQSGDDWDDDKVSLAHRAKPLLELLETAHKYEEHVFWDRG